MGKELTPEFTELLRRQTTPDLGCEIAAVELPKHVEDDEARASVEGHEDSCDPCKDRIAGEEGLN